MKNKLNYMLKLAFASLFILMSLQTKSQVYVDQTATLGAQNGTSWADAYLDIQSGIDAAAVSGGEVWVASGVYFKVDAELVISMANDVQIYGGFPTGGGTMLQRDYLTNLTVITGEYQADGDSLNNTNHLVKNSGVNSNALLDGFILTGSYENIGNNSNNNGRGAILNDNSSPTIQNCVFQKNVHNDGGAIVNINGSNALIRKCTFINNASNGWQSRGTAIYNDASAPTIDSCLFEGNLPQGAEPAADIFNLNADPDITNCVFQNKTVTTNSGAGAIYNMSSRPNIFKCIFDNITVKLSGGAIYNDASAPVIDSCTFSNILITNTAQDGGGIYVDSAYNDAGTMIEALIQNSTFINITLTGSNGSGNGCNGGGMFISNSSPTVYSCTFKDINVRPNPANTAHKASKGGGIACDNLASPLIDSCTFDHVTTLRSGGAFYSTGGSTPVVNQCTFVNDTAIESNGGVFYLDASGSAILNAPGNIEINGSTIANFRSGGNGGAVYAQDSATIIIRKTLFSGGSSNTSGACMYFLDKSNITLDSVVVMNSVCVSHGGGIYIINSKAIVDSCYIAGNEITGANVDGAGIYVSGGFDNGDGSFTYPEFTNSVFDGNIQDGGNGSGNGSEGNGLCIKNAVVNIDNCIFANATRGLDDRSLKGGGVAIGSASDVTITNTDFVNNTANEGAGVYNQGILTISDCQFIGDTAYQYGAGIRNVAGSIASISNCDFIANVQKGSWRAGAGISNFRTSVEINSCNFRGNILDATFGGFGIGISEVESSSNITNCLFEAGEQLAGNGGGGAISFDVSNTTVSNCTFVGNNAEFGGALIFTTQLGVDAVSAPVINNCIFLNNRSNSASRGNEIRIDDDMAEPEFNNCSFEFNYGGINGAGAGTTWTFAPDSATFVSFGNIFLTDPLFQDPTYADAVDGNEYFLSMGSPSINTGDSTGLNLGMYDLGGGLRISDTLVDMGAFEYQFIQSINVMAEGTATDITVNGDTLQIYANVFPATAYDTTITWTINAGVVDATVNADGQLISSGTLAGNGSVWLIAETNDGSNLKDSVEITISNQKRMVDSIVVAGTGDATEITVDGGTLQMLVTVYPADADVQDVTWSLVDPSATGNTMDAAGLITATGVASGNGVIYAKAVADDDMTKMDSIAITVSGQIELVTGITVTGDAGATTIDVDGGTLQMSAAILPLDADIQTVSWSITAGTGNASVDASGIVTAITDGTVDVVATADDGSVITGSLTLTLSNQSIKVNDILFSVSGGSPIIDTDGGDIVVYANVEPDDAADTTITWSIVDGTATASIDQAGMLTATGTNAGNGTVWVKATANDVVGYADSIMITISNQNLVNSIAISGTAGATSINIDMGTLQMLADVSPDDSPDTTFTWSVNDDIIATIDTAGLLTAVENGSVWVIATANDAGAYKDSLEITITSQITLVTDITISGAGSATTIDVAAGTLQLTAAILPVGATDKTVDWSVDDSNIATVDNTGLVTAVSNGTVIVSTTANDGSGITNTYTIVISNQPNSINEGESVISLYPNPTKGLVTISGLTGNTNILEVVDISGKTILNKTISGNQTEINLEDYPSGIYFISVKIDDERIVRRLIVQ